MSAENTVMSQFMKTKICEHFLQNRCKNGEKCRYAHTREELKPLPNLTNTKLCKSLKTNTPCTDPNCKYAHEVEQLEPSTNLVSYKTSVCYFWKKNKCLNQNKCRFAHGIKELRSEKVGKDKIERTIKNEQDYPIRKRRNQAAISKGSSEISSSHSINLSNKKIEKNSSRVLEHSQDIVERIRPTLNAVVEAILRVESSTRFQNNNSNKKQNNNVNSTRTNSGNFVRQINQSNTVSEFDAFLENNYLMNIKRKGAIAHIDITSNPSKMMKKYEESYFGKYDSGLFDTNLDQYVSTHSGTNYDTFLSSNSGTSLEPATIESYYEDKLSSPFGSNEWKMHQSTDKIQNETDYEHTLKDDSFNFQSFGNSYSSMMLDKLHSLFTMDSTNEQIHQTEEISTNQLSNNYAHFNFPQEINQNNLLNERNNIIDPYEKMTNLLIDEQTKTTPNRNGIRNYENIFSNKRNTYEDMQNDEDYFGELNKCIKQELAKNYENIYSY